LLSFPTSLAFILYTFIVFLIHLYSTSGRNAIVPTNNDNSIEMTLEGIRSQWYARVPGADTNAAHHVIEENDED